MTSPFSVKRGGDHRVLLTIVVVLTVLMFLIVSASEQSYVGGQTVQSGTPSIGLNEVVQSVNIYHNASSGWTSLGFTPTTGTVTLKFTTAQAKAYNGTDTIIIVTGNNSVDSNNVLHNNYITYALSTGSLAGISSVQLEMGSFLNGTLNLGSFSSKEVQNTVFTQTIFSGSVNELGDHETMPIMNLMGGFQTAQPMIVITGNFTFSTTSSPSVTFTMYHTSNTDLWNDWDMVEIGLAIFALIIVFVAYPRGHGV